MPKTVVINPFFDWGDDRPPRTPYHETVIYEAHVQGPDAAPPGRSPRSCAAPTPASAHPAMIEHLHDLGVTAVELMPVHQFVTDTRWSAQGLTNYWGYNTIGFFAPHNAYSLVRAARASRCRSSRRWSRTLHEAGIEVILDVVYNHTAEGNHLGPTLSFRGIDNAAYYRLRRRRQALLPRLHRHAATRSTSGTRTRCSSSWTRCATGSLEMHVDGFRFDLASTLAREFHDVDRLSAFFDLVQQDPVSPRSS